MAIQTENGQESVQSVSASGSINLAEDAEGLEPYEVIENPVVDQSYRLLDRGTDDDGEYLLVEIRYGSEEGAFPEHIQPKQDKIYEVVDGQFAVKIDGEERVYGPGEGDAIPAGTPHSYRPLGDQDARVLWEVRPPMAIDQIFRMTSTQAMEGRTKPDGTPKMLALAVFLNAHPDNVYLSAMPVGVQKVLFKLLAPLGRLVGYESDYSASPAKTNTSSTATTATA